MILKQRPEDFCVTELTNVHPGGRGPFAFYRLDKTGWTTHDALAAVRRRWDIEPARLSYGGLKDRHAKTTQYFTIAQGPKQHLSHERVRAKYLGQVAYPYGSRDISGNRFAVTLRDLSEDEVGPSLAAAAEVARCGLPNYFDDQRFGSATPGEPFIARQFVAGEFEAGLKQALSAPYAYDVAEQKREKELLRRHWGDWATLKVELPRSHSRSLVCYLADHPTDFRGAVARLRPDLRGLYLSAYQSWLWNRILAVWLRSWIPADQLTNVTAKLGELPMPRALDDAGLARLRAAQLPLPSARTRLAPDDPLGPLIASVLAEDGLTLPEMKIRGIRELFFSKGDRPAHSQPRGLVAQADVDETRPGKKKLSLRFELGRGAYATLLVKRIAATLVASPDADDAE